MSKLFQCRIREGQITSENGECENQRADLKVAGFRRRDVRILARDAYRVS